MLFSVGANPRAVDDRNMSAIDYSAVRGQPGLAAAFAKELLAWSVRTFLSCHWDAPPRGAPSHLPGHGAARGAGEQSRQRAERQPHTLPSRGRRVGAA